MRSRYRDLTRAQLAILVPELLLIGHLIDRSGMAWCAAAFGRQAMTRIAIEEWASASPIYTRRMQCALGYAPPEPGGGDVLTIFKGLQLDIGAPPQFMDFRFTVHDRWHGEFHLDHCGALMDVEPMGEEYVRAMCHDIEDGTFDAPALAVNERSRAASVALAPIDPADDGLADYAGPLMSDLDFATFSRSALARIADEVCLQMHLLDRGFVLAVAGRAATEADVVRIRRKQLVGIAGLAAERLIRALGLSREPEQVRRSAVRLLAAHPLLNPAAYVTASIAGDVVVVQPSTAHEDGAWVSLCGPEWTAPLQAIVRGLDPHLDVTVTPYPAAGDGAWRAAVVRRPEAAAEAAEVTVAKFSTGTTFTFRPRRSLPLTPR